MASTKRLWLYFIIQFALYRVPHTAYGQAINLTGTVTNAAGQAVSGVVVRMMARGLEGISDQNGSYGIMGQVAVAGGGPTNSPGLRYELAGDALILVISRDYFALDIRLFNIKGIFLAGIADATLRAGTYRIALRGAAGSAAAGAYIVRIMAGDQVYTRHTVLLTDHAHRFASESSPERLTADLYKSSRAATVDTLFATHANYGSTKVPLTVYTGIVNVRMNALDPYALARQQAVDRVNALRATIGLGPLARNASKEACVDSQAMHDATVNKAHDSFGACGESAQNECPGWQSAGAVTTNCIQMMWNEGPGADYNAHGHYLNMTNTRYTKICCGFYEKSAGVVWGVMDFW
jgi:hypothetical protein